MTTEWAFEADYFTYCNCDWGCPCNFNARPTQGNCQGVGAWRIVRGQFGPTPLDGVVFAASYFFPGLIENGNGTRRLYIDRKATPAQRDAIDAIGNGREGGGIFELFTKLSSKTYPTLVTDIEFRVDGPTAYLKIDDILEAESAALSYPDGTKILPTFTLPHGIEFKEALATNTKRWWIRDEAMLAAHENKYGAVARVKVTREGVVG
ncbi:MAG: DUF1326 domain-containing protein [Thermoplasmata archaeon]